MYKKENVMENLLTQKRLHLDNIHPQKKVIFMEHTWMNSVPGGWCGIVGEGVGSGQTWLYWILASAF